MKELLVKYKTSSLDIYNLVKCIRKLHVFKNRYDHFITAKIYDKK